MNVTHDEELFREQKAYSNRKYTALPHEYLQEMEILSDAEYGRLVRILQHYSISGEKGKPEGNERFYLSRVFNREDRYQEELRQLSLKRRENGLKGARKRWGLDPADREKIANHSKNGYSNPDPDPNPDPNPDPEPHPHPTASAVGVAYGREGMDPEALGTPGRGESFPAAATAVREEKRRIVSPFPVGGIRNFETEHDSPGGCGRGLRAGGAACGSGASSVEGQTASPEAVVVERMESLLQLKVSMTCRRELRYFVDRLGVEICLYAVDRAGDENHCNWSYIRGILRDLDAQGIRSVGEAEALHCSHSRVSADRSRARDKPQSQFQLHSTGTTLTPLERQAVASALAEDDFFETNAERR